MMTVRWTRTGDTRPRYTYTDESREILAEVHTMFHGGYAWNVIQFRRVLASGSATKLAQAKAAAAEWVAVATEVTPA